MNFLQIEEPENKDIKKDETIAVGIDLGTTNSLISCVIENKAKILGPILPSVYQGIRSIKRYIGSEKKVNQLSPVEIASKILIKLKNQAEQILEKEINKAVITVPAHFDDAARNDTKLAAQAAGFEVLRLVNEPTAAALSYGLDSKAEGVYLIYDLGGGTFDVSILKMEKGVFQVLATGGDRNLGGDDIDYKIMEYLNLPEEFHFQARSIKENICLGQKEAKLSKEEFEEIAKPFIEKTIDICLNTIEQSKNEINDIKEIVLVGGSTRIPLLKKIIEEKIKKPLDSIDPDTVVALGAAIQADGLVNGSNNLLIDVTSLSIGLEIMGGINEKVIPKNSSIPINVTKYFTTYEDGQTGIIFHIVQGEREMAADCRSLAKFELKAIPPMKASLPKVAVTFAIDADGILNISAVEEISGIKQKIEVKPSYGITKEEIEKLIDQSYVYAAEDIEAKKLAKIKFIAKNNIKNIKEALEEDLDLLRDFEREDISLAITKLQEDLLVNDLKIITASNEALEKISSKFIQDRLNKQIKNALAGKYVRSTQ